MKLEFSGGELIASYVDESTGYGVTKKIELSSAEFDLLGEGIDGRFMNFFPDVLKNAIDNSDGAIWINRSGAPFVFSVAKGGATLAMSCDGDIAISADVAKLSCAEVCCDYRRAASTTVSAEKYLERFSEAVCALSGIAAKILTVVVAEAAERLRRLADLAGVDIAEVIELPRSADSGELIPDVESADENVHEVGETPDVPTNPGGSSGEIVNVAAVAEDGAMQGRAINIVLLMFEILISMARMAVRGKLMSLVSAGPHGENSSRGSPRLISAKN